MELTMVKGNEALGEAAVRAGCRFFFGYPITPQSELPAYMARRMPEVQGTYLQAESEVAAINMVLGAAAAGVRAMTSSSSPGFSLKQEGISYMIGSELPAVVVNIMRGGPGLGNIQPSQGDYFQMVKGGGHGDYHMITLAPSTVQELVDLVYMAFDLGEKYRNPVAVLGDGLLGQTMEPVRFPAMKEDTGDKDWALTGCKDRGKRVITSLELNPEDLEVHNLKLQAKFDEIKKAEARWEEYLCADADLVVVAYGTSARIARAAVDGARSQGLKVGLFRPITLWPFPTEALSQLVDRGVTRFLDVEMSSGQM
ncbi:MAG TPA: 3-methyl-2-oxobutanoate dehydrogenase subunit VorB, partial [Symbiobacteriaceae bacterium]|nr:3-methyl-2-oxobutanoate dehydrogenase subunit VorB [Symbiobacteriaceae bacterium]